MSQDEAIAAIAEAADDERAVGERSGARAVVVAVEPAPAALISGGQRSVVFGLAAVLFAAVAVFALVAYLREATFYDGILEHARGIQTCGENVMAFEIALAPFRSLAIVRAAALFLSFVLVVLGSLFVLVGIEAAYKVSASRGEAKATLETTSPGLVLATAGALLMAASLYRSGSPEFKPTDCWQTASPVTNHAGTSLDALKGH